MTEVLFARADDGTHVAYRVLDADASAGSARDVVLVPTGLIPLELYEEEPGFARLLDGLRSLGRVIVFDRRGLGLSDPISDWTRPVADQWAEDLAAVADAANAHDIVLVACEGYGIGSRYAVAHSEKMAALVLYEPILVAGDDWTSWTARSMQRNNDNMAGDADILSVVAPSRIDDRTFRDWFTRAGRAGASPTTATRIWESVISVHSRDARYEQVVTPTLVVHRRDNAFIASDVLELAAERMPHAVVVELDGADHFPFVGDVDALVAEIAEFVVGERRIPAPQRVLSAVMFTDLVGSTERAASIGDEEWKAVLDRHDTAVRAIVGRCGGSVVKTTGDGVLALLPSAGVCLRAAAEIRRDLAAEGLEVRIGVHVGDVDRRGNDVSGLAVNIASRAMSNADPGEIVVTASVIAAVAGQAVGFEPLGTRDLKGVPGTWDLFRVRDEPW